MRAVAHLSRIAVMTCSHGFGPLILELGIQELIRLLPKGTSWGRPRAKTIGRRVRILFEELGPTFQKFGQLLSTQSDLFPEEVIHELQKLQTNLPPMANSDLKKTLKKQWGKKHPLLKKFDLKPKAVASIGQLHKTYLEDGRPVAIKIQRPDIERIIRSDLQALEWISQTLLKAKPAWKKYNILGILNLFQRSLLSELDFKNELKQFSSMKLQAAGLGVNVPAVYTEYSTEKILVMDWIEGRPVTELAQETPTDHSRIIAHKLLSLVLDQIFIKGHFHGDPHPGNFLVTKSGDLTMIDLGLTGKLTKDHRRALVQALRSVLSGNSEKMADALIKMSSLQPSPSTLKDLQKRLAPELEKIFAEIRKGAGLEKSLQKVFRAAAALDIIVDVEYVLMLKALLTIESLCRQLDPQIRVFAVARPIVFKGLIGWSNPFELLRSRLR